MDRDDELFVQANGDKQLYRYLKKKDRATRREKRRARRSLRIGILVAAALAVFLYLLTKVHIIWIW